MKKALVFIMMTYIFVIAAMAQQKPVAPAPAAAKDEIPDKVNLPNLVFNPDWSTSTDHDATIKGQHIPYKATTGTMPVWDDDGKCIAGLFYTYYERSDIKDRATRPLVISFNGGPGSASVWMQIAYTGPRMLTIDDEGYPVQPYGMK